MVVPCSIKCATDFDILKFELRYFSSGAVSPNRLHIECKECSDVIINLDIFKKKISVSRSFNGSKVKNAAATQLCCRNCADNIDSTDNIIRN
jgi:hypothetical protein